MEIKPTILYNIQALGKNVQLPNASRNHSIFDDSVVDNLALNFEESLPYLQKVLQNESDEKKIIETMAVMNKIADTNPDAVKKMYPYLARFNDTNSPNIQVMLSGVYRKIMVPDAFGPLTRMLYKQTFFPNSPYFDPTEETGGAILEYLTSYGAVEAYKSK